MDNFSFLFRVTSCKECPYLDKRYIPDDCIFNKTEDIWADSTDTISENCPFRKFENIEDVKDYIRKEYDKNCI